MSNDPLRAYEYELIERMEEILHAFHFHLLDGGVSARQAEQRLANAELFLIQYHAYHYLNDVSSLTPQRISDFLCVWYFERIESRSESDWKETLQTLDLFLRYLLDSKTIQSIGAQALFDAVEFPGEYETLENEYNQQPLSVKRQDDVPLEDFFVDEAPIDDDLALTPPITLSFQSCASFHEMVDSIQHDLPSIEPRKNVIALKPAPSGDGPPNPVAETDNVQEFILDLLRGDLVFHRWLERKRRHLKDVRGALLHGYQHYETLLLHINQLARELPPSEEEAAQGCAVLDQLDKQLWSLRNRIAAEFRLDLRSLCL
ncbi:MAG: hypothetical protein P9L94_15295 [Candidatus Hinthialibacter antarcticus]|nr:hypothetical protein [Candidatus Hinthialibacter antarcticus]